MGEAQRMESGRVKAGSLHVYKTKTDRNRTIGISKEFHKEFHKELPKVNGRSFADTNGTFLKVFHSIGLNIPRDQASHVFRHTLATLSIKNRGNILDLKVLLDHSKIEMAMYMLTIALTS
jgi:integrase